MSGKTRKVSLVLITLILNYENMTISQEIKSLSKISRTGHVKIK